MLEAGAEANHQAQVRRLEQEAAREAAELRQRLLTAEDQARVRGVEAESAAQAHAQTVEELR